MAKKNVHVVTTKSDALPWAVKIEGKKAPVSQHHTQKAAENAGRLIAKKLECELMTHNLKGQIRSKDSFGNESEVKDTEN
ncbi:MAG: DUF2188 domain-containing protein [Patescibacteria group bacterium]|nr:DUF2188 domain-containing protein [Patescibacteria group bacterium]